MGEKKISVLEELEHKYGLTCAIHSTQPDRLYQIIEEWLAMPNLKEEWHKRRDKMLSEKIDVTAFYTWFLEGFPQTRELKYDPTA